jgi:hypothetical protein
MIIIPTDFYFIDFSFLRYFLFSPEIGKQTEKLNKQFDRGIREMRKRNIWRAVVRAGTTSQRG